MIKKILKSLKHLFSRQGGNKMRIDMEGIAKVHDLDRRKSTQEKLAADLRLASLKLTRNQKKALRRKRRKSGSIRR